MYILTTFADFLLDHSTCRLLFLLLPLPFLIQQPIVLQPFYCSPNWLSFWVCLCLLSDLCCQLHPSEINYSHPIQTVCSKALHDNFSNFIFSSMTAGTPSSFLMQCSSIISWLVLTTLSAVLNTPHFWSSHYIQIFLNLFLYFTLCLVNSSTSLFFVSRYSFLLIFPCFHSFHSLPFPLTTPADIIIPPPSFFCLDGHFFYLQLLSVTSSKGISKICQKPLTEVSFWVLAQQF